MKVKNNEGPIVLTKQMFDLKSYSESKHGVPSAARRRLLSLDQMSYIFTSQLVLIRVPHLNKTNSHKSSTVGTCEKMLKPVTQTRTNIFTSRSLQVCMSSS